MDFATQEKVRNAVRAYASNLVAGAGLNARDFVSHTGLSMFSISPPQENALRVAMMEDCSMLKSITVRGVSQLQGQVIDVGNPGLFTGRKKGRFSKDVGLSGNKYILRETDSCARLSWEVLANWAHSGASEDEFIQMVAKFTTKSFALDQLRVGFNGTSAAEFTDEKANPNGEDINVGWHQIAKNFDTLHANDATPEIDRIPGFTQRVLVPGVEALTIGKGGVFETLDALCSWVLNTTIPAPFRNSPDLVFLIGADLIAAEQFRLFQAAGTPTENIAAQMLANTVAGKRAFTPDFFPGKRLVVTTLTNLHLYIQNGTQQRRAEQVQDRKGFENAWWRMQGYALGHPLMYGAVDETAIKILAEQDVKSFSADAMSSVTE